MVENLKLEELKELLRTNRLTVEYAYDEDARRFILRYIVNGEVAVVASASDEVFVKLMNAMDTPEICSITDQFEINVRPEA